MAIARPHLDLLLRLHPRGRAWSLDPAMAPYQELEAWGEVLDAQDAQVNALLDEAVPDRASSLLGRWEALFDLHPRSGLSEAERRRRVLARMAYLPDTRPVTIEDILEAFTSLDVAIVEPGAFRCDDAGSVCDEPDDVLDGAWVWWVEDDETAARAGDVTRLELEQELQRIKPAHTVAYVRCDDFITDDPWSLCDRDLLGA